MQTILTILLIIHIAAGAASLASGLVAILSKKGFGVHSKAGNTYFAAMITVAVTATILALFKGTTFLLHIGIFSFFMTYSGKNAVSRTPQPLWATVMVLGLAGLNGMAMLATMNYILMIFGAFNSLLVYREAKSFFKKKKKAENYTDRVTRHISMMIGSYIATTTAFLVNVQTFLPGWTTWLGPTVIGTPLITYWIAKTKKGQVKKAVAVFVLVVAGILSTQAQPYVEGGKTRHRFAQMTLGADVRFFPAGIAESARVNDNGEIDKFKLRTYSETRLLIGGTHFWGHADFYVAFPVASFGDVTSFTGIETGARVYPWRIEPKKLRPFAGVSLLPVLFRQGAGATVLKNKLPIQAGFTYARKKHLVEISAGYNYNNKQEYYISPTIVTGITTPLFWVSVGYKYMFETTLSAEKAWKSGYTKKLTDTLASLGRLNGFTFAIGPSSAFFLKNSPHNEATAPYAGAHKISFVPVDIGMGYYWHKPDVQFNIAYRSYKSHISAYGFEQTLRRKALSAEAYKFLFDYHGFVPFVGPAISYEQLRVNETGSAANYNGVKPGLTFGWDIRPNRLQFFYLRTNLRWFPNLSVNMPDGKSVIFDGIEFNFIQLVLFPGRMF